MTKQATMTKTSKTIDRQWVVYRIDCPACGHEVLKRTGIDEARTSVLNCDACGHLERLIYTATPDLTIEYRFDGKA